MRLMRAAVMVSGGDPERLARLHAIVARAKGDLNEFLGQGEREERAAGASPAGGPPPPPPPPGPVEDL
ncbi:MAG: hypothetical protein IVW57_16960 [Ktedonobacterales bacterium]|nr:hypothetical protein [Ktedonobacterales bacterium]